MQGIDLPDEGEEELTGEDVIKRAQAKAMGKTSEQVDLEEIGFAYESED